MNWRLALIIFVAFFGGCAQVPQAAIDVSRQVTIGISSLGANGQDLVSAWEETAFALVDERWNQIYKRAEDELRAKRQIAKATSLTPEQQSDVAGLATLLRDGMRKNISDKAVEMRKVLSGNTKTTLEANESVTQLLVSASSVLSTQKAAAKQVTEHVKLPTELSKFVSELIKQ